GPLRRVPLGLENQRVLPVPPPSAVSAGGGCELPEAGRLVAQQGGEASRRVESGQAQPVHRTVLADQRRGLQIPEQSVVLDPLRHGRSFLAASSVTQVIPATTPGQQRPDRPHGPPSAAASSSGGPM